MRHTPTITLDVAAGEASVADDPLIDGSTINDGPVGGITITIPDDDAPTVEIQDITLTGEQSITIERHWRRGGD